MLQMNLKGAYPWFSPVSGRRTAQAAISLDLNWDNDELSCFIVTDHHGRLNGQGEESQIDLY